MKTLIRFSIIILISFSFFLLLPSCESTYLGRWVAWNFSDIKDHQKFPKRDITNADPVFNFATASDKLKIANISYTYKGVNYQKAGNEFVEDTQTTAFIVIKNDTILYEGYGNGYTQSSINTSFSIAKSITSMLMGIAIDEGMIRSIQEPITNYLPELLESDSSLTKVTISNLLMMQSGFYYRDHDLV